MSSRTHKLNKLAATFFQSRSFDECFLYALTRRLQKVSLRELSQSSGVSLGALSMLASGNRTASLSQWNRLTAHLHLNKEEYRFLLLLWDFQYGATPEVKVKALRNILRNQKYRKQFGDAWQAAQYLSNFLYVVIREMAHLNGFRADPSWIQDQLRIEASQQEIIDALTFLERSGFIEIEKDKSVRVREANLTCDDGLFLFSLSEYHRQALRYAERSIEHSDSSERAMRGVCLSIPASKRSIVDSILQKAIEDIQKVSEGSSEHDSVYQVELAAYPVAKVKKE